MLHGQGCACFPQNSSTEAALGHAGVVSCIGGQTVYCFCTFEKILSYSGQFRNTEFIKSLNKIGQLEIFSLLASKLLN